MIGEEQKGTPGAPFLPLKEQRGERRQEQQGGPGCDLGGSQALRGPIPEATVADLIVILVEHHEP